MLKKKITFTDYNGEERTEEFLFNLTKAEVMEMELNTVGGMEAYITRIMAAKNIPELTKIFTTIIRASYGVKSPDGRKFMKSDAIFEDFHQTEAYSQLFMELLTDAKATADFINGVLPKVPDSAALPSAEK